MMACFDDAGVDVNVTDIVICSRETKEDSRKVVAVQFRTSVATMFNTDS